MEQTLAMEDLRKLDEFVATISYGRDLFPSVRSLLVYSFGNRSISDLFISATANPKYMDKCKEIAKALCCAATEAVDSLLLQDGITKKGAQVTESLAFFWEIYQLKRLPDLVQSKDLLALEDSLEKITQLVQDSGLRRNLRSLPIEFLRILNIESSSPSALSTHDLPLFLKDISHENFYVETTKEQQSSVHRLEKEIEKIRAGDIDMNTIKELADIKSSDYMSSKDAARLGARIVSIINVAKSSAEIGAAFCFLLEKLFLILSDDDKRMLMKLMYEKHLSEYDCLPSLEIYLENASSGITQCINQIGDHVDIQTDAAKFKTVRDKLAWYLLTIPQTTLNRLLMQSLDNKLIVPGVMNILRLCIPLFHIQIKSEKISSERVPVLIDSVVSIFEEHFQRWTNVEQQDRLVYLLTSLCRRRTHVKEKSAEDQSCIDCSENNVFFTCRKRSCYVIVRIKKPQTALKQKSKDFYSREILMQRSPTKPPPATVAVEEILDGGTLLRLFVLPNLMKRTHEILMLKLLLRLLQSVGTKEIRFEWTKSIGRNGTESVQAPELVLLIVELFIEYESRNQQASGICRIILKCLSEKLKGDGIVFEKDTVDFLLFSLRRYHWWVRYAVCSWFSHTLSSPAQQLPTGLYKCLPLEQQEQCEQISVDFSFSPAECFFRSFFELALFDVDLAADFLKKGISVYPRDENIVEKIALALVETCEQTFIIQSVTSLAPLLLELMRLLDPSHDVHLIESLCESTFHGLRLIQHLLLLSTAVKLAYYKSSDKALNNCPRSKDPVTDTAHVADALLQGFCELAKAHAEKEVVNLRRSRLPFPPEIKEDHLPPPQITIRRDERVYAQLSALFNISCSITRLVAHPPVALQVLINCLAESLFEVQKLRAGAFLDDLPSGHFKSNTVYAFAQPTHLKRQAENSGHLDAVNQERGSPPTTASVIRGENGTYCIENELFDPSGALRTKGTSVEALATARQINGANLRKNAENRLSHKETLPAGSNISSLEQRDNPGKNSKKKRSTKRR